MKLRTVLTIFAFSFLIIGCERMAPPPKGYNPDLVWLNGDEPIPLSYGRIVSITEVEPGLAHLWFEDENHTIRQVEINYGEGFIYQDVRVIERNVAK